MTDKLNEFLAVEVMGWESSARALLKWNPTENIEQAMMSANRFSGGRNNRVKIIIGEFTQCWIQTGNASENFWDTIAHAASVNTCEAISLACARAKGWKDE